MLEFECVNIGDNSAVFQVPCDLEKQALLEWYNQALQFPYFGFNWDSLYDLLSDLNWIREKHIWVCHSDLPSLPEDELIEYINILHDTIRNWKPGEAHVFHASFPLSAKARLQDC